MKESLGFVSPGDFLIFDRTILQIIKGYMIESLGVELAKKLAISLTADFTKTKGKAAIESIFGTNENDFTKELRGTIQATVESFIKECNIPNEGNKFPFYNSEILIQHLLSIKFLEKDKIDSIELKRLLSENGNIIPPKETDILRFLELFEHNCKNNHLLKKHQFNNNYRAAIFTILEIVEAINNSLYKAIHEISSTLKGEYTAQFDEIQANIDSFKPKTAYDRLLGLKNRIIANNLFTPEIESKLLYLQGTCMLEAEWDKKGLELIIRSYLKNPNTLFKGETALAYYNLQELDKAEQLVKLILEEDPYNSLAWLISVFLSGDGYKEILKNVPKSVFDRRGFQLTAIKFLTLSHKLHYSEIIDLGLKVPENFEENVTHANCVAYEIMTEILLSNYFEVTREFSFDGKGKVKYSNLEELPKLISVLSRFLNSIKGTEIDNKHHHHKFYYYFLRHLLDDNNFDQDEFSQIFLELQSIRFEYSLHYAQYKANIGDVKGALAIIEVSPFKFHKLLAFHRLYYLLISNQREEAYKHLRNHLNELNDITFEDIFNIIDFFRLFLPDTDLLRTESEKLLNTKQFSSPEIKLLFKNTLEIKYFPTEANKIKFGNDLHFLGTHFLDQTHILYFICELLNEINEYSKCLDLIEPFITPGQQTRANSIFALASINIPNRRRDLLSFLENIRTNNENNDYQLLSFEYNLRREINDINSIINICFKGISQYPNQEIFHQTLLSSLEQKNDQEGIKKYVNTFYKDDFENESVGLWVCNILSRNDFIQEAAILQYNLARKVQNVLARTKYILFPFPEGFLVSYNEVELGSFVKLARGEGSVKLLKVDNVDKFRLIGKKANEMVLIPEKIGHKFKEYTVAQIMNDKMFLLQEILQEADDENSDLPMQSFSFVNDEGKFDIKKFNSFIVSQMGPEDTLRNEKIEKIIQDYYIGKESFGDLCRNVFDNSCLECYEFLTSSKVLALSSYLNHDLLLAESKDIAIDFTALVLLSDLEIRYKLVYPHRFIISSNLTLLIKNELIKLKSQSSPRMRLVVNNGRINSIVYPENYQELQVQKNETLLKFIERFCTERLVEERVELTYELSGKSDTDLFVNYQIDNTLFASNLGYTLVTNDSFPLRYFQGINMRIISPENYLSQVFSVQYPYEIMEYYTRNNYVGVRTSPKLLYNEYNKKQKGENNHFNSALINLNFKFNHTFNAFTSAIEFLKNVYLNDLSLPEERALLTNSIFSYLFNGRPHNDKITLIMSQKIDSEFMLMGTILDQMRNSFQTALNANYNF